MTVEHKPSMQKHPGLLLLTTFLLLFVFQKTLTAQISNSSGEQVKCFIKRNSNNGTNKLRTDNVTYELKENQIGNFNCIYNILPFEKIPIEMVYPKGVAGENVVISVEDGGKLDNNKGLKVVPLDRKKTAAFVFIAAADPGMYRLLITKGQESKVVQLWVGPDPGRSK